MHILPDDLRSPAVAALLQQHLHEASLHSPPGSVHALDLDRLRAPDIAFWCAWDGEALLGCCALKALDPLHGEIKSMRTADAQQRRGVASALMRHLVGEARRRGYRRLSLETGLMDAFAPARALYARFGFVPCGPFAHYVDDPYSAFMTLALE